jgi:LysM repeat protein
LSVGSLAEMNGISDPDRIFVGQRLVIRDQPPAAQAADGPTVSHAVAPGETLSGIAVKYGASVAAIAQANGISNTSYIRAGQVLAIPGAVSPSQAQPAPAAATLNHRVVAGETLWGIAVRYGASVAAIAQANGISNTSYIRAGQVLAIPGAADASGAAKPQVAAPSRSMPASMAVLVSRRQEVAQLIATEAARQGVPVAFALAVAWQESGWQPGVVSSAGAIGVMQLLPSTAEWVAGSMLGHGVNLWDAGSNIEAGVALLRHYLDRYGGDRSLALAAYYQGQTAVDRHGIYPVTRPYVASISELERIFAG